jgi:arylsulfatase A-like enzyme
MRFDISLAGDYKDLPKNLTGAAKKKWVYQRFVKDYYGAIAAVDRFMYEPSLKVPLIVRAPGGKRGQVVPHMAQNIDIAPTILDYAGLPAPGSMQGRSLRRILEGEAPADWRKSVYYAYYENSWALAGKGKDAMADPSFQFFTPHRVGPHRGVRTETHKLIHYYSDGDYQELFDLREDPNELTNLYGRHGMESITASLKQELERLRRLYRDT